MGIVTRRGATVFGMLFASWLSSGPSVVAGWFDVRPPVIRPIEIEGALWDLTPVVVSVTTGHARIPTVVTAHALQTDPMLWRRMHLADWNKVPVGLRRSGLDALLRSYAPVVSNPYRWAAMTAFDWDAVPQPIRILAYYRMIAYWVDVYSVGIHFGLGRADVRDTLAAIVMSESWFDHRAEYVGVGDIRDIGLGQASTSARARMRRLYRTGHVDVYLAETDYTNPFHATRFVAIWMKRLLAATDGDIDVAVRAYHRGIRHAMDERGSSYLATVKRRRRRFIDNHDSPAAWNYVWKTGNELERLTAAPSGDRR